MPKEYIECRNCDSPYCNGCNIYTLATMLRKGKFDCLMDEDRSVNPAADVVEVVKERMNKMENKMESIKKVLAKQLGYMLEDLTEKDSILIVLKKEGKAARGHRYGGDIGLKEMEELLKIFGAYEKDTEEFVSSSGHKVTIVR